MQYGYAALRSSGAGCRLLENQRLPSASEPNSSRGPPGALNSCGAASSAAGQHDEQRASRLGDVARFERRERPIVLGEHTVGQSSSHDVEMVQHSRAEYGRT